MLSPTLFSPHNVIDCSLPHSLLVIQPFAQSSNSRYHNKPVTYRSLWGFSCKTASSSYNCQSLSDIGGSLGNLDDEFSDNPSFSHSSSPYMLVLWLRSCPSLSEVRILHAVVWKCLRNSVIYVYNNLICAYLRFGKLSNARHVFDNVTLRNVVTWTALINGYLSFGYYDEALSLFFDSIKHGVQANGNMFVCVLNLCSNTYDFEIGTQIHGCVIKGGFGNLILDSAIVKFYAQFGDLSSAFRKFYQMPNWDVVCYTTMITACSQQRHGKEAFLLYSQMLKDGIFPNEFTVCGVLKACGEEEQLNFGRQLHGAVIKKIYKNDVFVGTSLVDMYAKCGEIVDSRNVFNRMRNRNTVTWTSLIAGYVRRAIGEEAIYLFRVMEKRNIFANNLTIVSILRACGLIRNSLLGREVHAKVIKNSIENSLHVGNTLVWFYCRCGEYSNAIKVLQQMPLRDVVSWTAIISGCTHLGYESEALELLKEMIADGVAPNSFTYSSALRACAQLETIFPGKLLHSSANKTLAMSNVFVGSALIHMYAKCGYAAEAFRVFDNMPERNLVSWKSMIIGYARNGLCQEALKLMYRMQAEGFKVDDYIIATVFIACGDVEQNLGLSSIGSLQSS